MSAKWSHSEGTRPHTVTVFEREPGGTLYARAWDPSAMGGKGNWRLKSLGHRDKKAAKAYAKLESSKLVQGQTSIADGRVTFAQICALYLQHKTPNKSEGQQKADEQRVELWTRVLGGTSDPHDITPEQWARFIRARTSGKVDARGNPVPSDKRKKVRARTVEIECDWLRFLFNWASAWRLSHGRYLMRSNPIKGDLFDVPREKNPRQPVASEEYYETLRQFAPKHMMEIRQKRPADARGFIPEKVPSYLPDLLDLAHETARRIEAICSLRYQDLKLTKSKSAPYGSVRWPEDVDKEQRAWEAPLTSRARAALNRALAERPGAGSGYLFPAPGNPSEPVATRLVGRWLRELEKMAGVEHVHGQGWHSFRRKWATDRTGVSDVNAMAAGGWKSLAAFKRYQKPDPESVLDVVLAVEKRRQAN